MFGRYCQSTRVGWISKECVIVWSSPQLAAIIIKQNAKTLLRPNSSFELTKRRTIHVYTCSACKIDELMIHNTWKVGKRIPMQWNQKNCNTVVENWPYGRPGLLDLEGLNPSDPILILFQRHRLVHNDLHNKLHLQFNLNRVWSPCCHQVIKGGINLGMASYFIISSLMLITMPMLSMSMTKTMVLMGTASYLASSVSSLDNSPHLTPGSLQPPSYNG